MTTPPKMYKLVGSDGKQYLSPSKGTLGGYSRGKTKIYGRLDCKSAAMWIARGHYVDFRVFFPDEKSAIGAGFRPCGKCMPSEHARWKAAGKGKG